ncbi:hypothetical protein [Thauera sp. Sel9]|uniref:hypothetical protein n=1 Tax=Thauera sp. Sel9 TaxID=2974299 RepID=UPI0021E10E1E|nr:hypothetical protein [Thauera sp. Sel9]MCV2216114.1 hypothetical protein [Thauera sp. Sel9]
MSRRNKKRNHKQIKPGPAAHQEENGRALEIAKTLVDKPELIPGVLNEPRVAALIVQQNIHRSFFPAPETLRELEFFCPGATHRLLKEAERNGRHGRMIEGILAISMVSTRLLGQLMAAGLAIAAMSGAYDLAMEDKDIAAFMAGLTGIALLAGIFVGRRKQENSRSDDEPDAKTTKK